MLSVTRVHAQTDDYAAMAEQLDQLSRQMPALVQGMAVVLESAVPLDLADYAATLKRAGMKVLGVSGDLLAEQAEALNLPVLAADSGGRAPRPASAPAPAPEPAVETPAPVAAEPPRTTARRVREPVRGGQQIYARGTDLTVIHQVGAGAEVVADGNIHIYGRLAGRAIAGADGNDQARIFCRRFEPELVAIAGVYAVAEQLQGDWTGKPAQVFLQDGTLTVERID
jgi:septum site-determining protein MinC